MKLWLHHINRVSENVERLRRFYSDVMSLGEHTEDLPLCKPTRDYTGDVAFMSNGNIQMHLAQKDLGLPYRAGKAVNPVERGHTAFRTDDIEAFKKRLEANSVSYSNYAGIATGGWHRIFSTTRREM